MEYQKAHNPFFFQVFQLCHQCQISSNGKRRLTFVQCDFSQWLGVRSHAGDIILLPCHPVCCHIHDEVRLGWGNFWEENNSRVSDLKDGKKSDNIMWTIGSDSDSRAANFWVISHSGAWCSDVFEYDRWRRRSRMQRWSPDIADPLLIYHHKRNTKHFFSSDHPQAKSAFWTDQSSLLCCSTLQSSLSDHE